MAPGGQLQPLRSYEDLPVGIGIDVDRILLGCQSMRFGRFLR